MQGVLGDQVMVPLCEAGSRSHSEAVLGCMVWSITVTARLQRIKIDLVAEPGTERLDRPCRVVLAPVEAAIYDGLDALSDRLEQGGHGEGGAGDGPTRRPVPHLTEELAEDQDGADVARSEDAVSRP